MEGPEPASTIPYAPFDPAGAHVVGSIGWDAWAEEYAELPAASAAYRFSKGLVHALLDEETGGRRGLRVLDFNCGCGNDFPYFLEAGHRVVGCDGSAGMLRVAARRFADRIDSGDLALFLGRAESLEEASFGGRRFDLIYSGTGGMAYLDDAQLQAVHRSLVSLLAPGGRMVVTHLLPRCWIESAYYAAKLRPRSAFRRWRATLQVTVRGEVLTMHFRSVARLRRLLGPLAPPARLIALNVVTPPFQTGFVLPTRLEGLLGAVERRARRTWLGRSVADQVAWITRVP